MEPIDPTPPQGQRGEGSGLLDQILAASRGAERSSPEVGSTSVSTILDEAMKGTATWSRNALQAIQTAIGAIEHKVAHQLTAILHHPDFQSLEASWRGLHFLVGRAETDAGLAIKALNVSKQDLIEDLATSREFDQSRLCKKLLEPRDSEGGDPFSILICDEAFGRTAEDVEILAGLSVAAGVAGCLAVSGAAPGLLGLDRWN